MFVSAILLSMLNQSSLALTPDCNSQQVHNIPKWVINRWEGSNYTTMRSYWVSIISKQTVEGPEGGARKGGQSIEANSAVTEILTQAVLVTSTDAKPAVLSN